MDNQKYITVSEARFIEMEQELTKVKAELTKNQLNVNVVSHHPQYAEPFVIYPWYIPLINIQIGTNVPQYIIDALQGHIDKLENVDKRIKKRVEELRELISATQNSKLVPTWVRWLFKAN